MRVKRGDDAASDHHMLLATLRLRLKRYNSPTNTTRTRYNVNLWSDKETADKFQINLANRYQVLQQLYDQANIQLEKNGTRQRRCGLRQLIGKGPNRRTKCRLKLYERYKRDERRRPY